MKNRNEMLKRITDSIEKISDATVKQYFTVGTADVTRIEDKGNVAILLNNFKKICDEDQGADFITNSNYGPYVQEFWPIVTAWYPEFPLKDLVSVQGMDKPLAYLFFTRLLTGKNKANTVAGELVETATGKRVIRGRYPTGEIFGEALAPADLEFDGTEKQTIGIVAYFPLTVSGSDTLDKYLMKVTSTNADLNGDLTVLSVVNNWVNFRKGASTNIVAQLNTETGQIIIIEDAAAVASSVSAISVNYVWNIEYATEVNLPTIEEDVERVPMEAIPRALGIKWSIFSEYVKKQQFGKDIRTDTTKRVLELLYHYQCRYVLDQMYDYAAGFVGTDAAGTVYEISLAPTSAVTIETRVQEVLTQLAVVGNAIEYNVGRMAGNRIVASQVFKSWLESLPSTFYTPVPTDQGYNAPRKIGKFGPYEVFYDPQRAANEGFMTYRGSDWYDAVYYIGEFMPIVPTDAIALGVTVRASMVSMEAYKFHKKAGVTKLNFTNA